MRPGTLAVIVVLLVALMLFAWFLLRRGEPGRLQPPNGRGPAVPTADAT